MSEKKTLVNLTQGFLKIVAEANGNDIDIAVCENILHTSKRRLYDVINVLAGVGLIGRSGKSKVHWTGGRLLQSNDCQRSLTSDHEKELDGFLERIETELTDLSSSELFKKCAWINKEDMKNISNFNDEINWYALSGSPDISITMKDDEGEQYCCHLIGKSGNEGGELNIIKFNEYDNLQSAY